MKILARIRIHLLIGVLGDMMLVAVQLAKRQEPD